MPFLKAHMARTLPLEMFSILTLIGAILHLNERVCPFRDRILNITRVSFLVHSPTVSLYILLLPFRNSQMFGLQISEEERVNQSKTFFNVEF